MKPVFSLAQVKDALTTNWGTTVAWDSNNITYAINLLSAANTSPENGGWQSMSSTMQATARLAFELWDDVIAVNLNESAVSGANIAFNYSSTTSGNGTYASISGTGGGSRANMRLTNSDIWMNSGWSTHNDDADFYYGGYGLSTYLHEIGHALGLSHPGAYNGSGTYDSDAEYYQDTRQYTVMSYFNASTNGSGTDHTGGSGYGLDFAASPLLHDIYALQQVYGADMTTRTGNTVYGFNSTANRAVFDFSQNVDPVVAIWDAGGTDTIDVSGWGTSQFIDLNAGAFSSVGYLTNNLAVAHGATIENAIGGWGNDYLIGNSASNVLTGGLGADYIMSGSGFDVFALRSAAEGGDSWNDFDQASDTIHLTASGFALGATGTLGAAGVAFALGSAASIAGATVIWDEHDARLYWDADGTGAGQKVLLARIYDEPDGVSVDNSWRVDGSGDFNGDGDSDIVWRNTSGECLIWEMQGNNRVNGYLLGDVDSSWSLAAFGDFTGDGTSDVLWHNTVSGEVLNWKMAGHQKDNGFLLGYIDPSWAVDGCGDFNGDGTDDFIFRNKISNESVVWTMNNGVKTSGYGLGVIDNSWKFSGAGDFDNDGTDDVAFRNSITGELLLWKMQDGQKDNGFLLGQIDKSWDIASTMDTNSNGTDDITWHNSQSGEVLTWTVSNMQKQNGSLSCVVGSNWDAVGTGDFNSNNVADLLWWDASGKLITSQFNDWNQANVAAGDILFV